MSEFDGTCPNCDRELSFGSIEVTNNGFTQVAYCSKCDLDYIIVDTNGSKKLVKN